MRFLTNIPIKRKMTLVILLASTVAVLAASLALFVYQVITVQRSYMRDLETLAEIIANQSNVALAFDDQSTAQESLSALKMKPNILAALIQKNGATFARFGPEEADFPVQIENGHEFVGDDVIYVRPILLNQQPQGKLFLRAEYRKTLNQLVQALIGTLVVVLAGSILLTLALSTRLQRVISDPILRLAETASTVAEKKDYSVRAAQVGQDELGLFTEAFNQMLAQIQTQDAALQKARDELENRVVALQHEIAERERAERELEMAHRELLEASRRAGMADVATGVLHNVGNVLNSVNVSTALLRDAVGKSEMATVSKLSNLLSEHSNNLADFLSRDPRGRQIPHLLTNLSRHLSEERAQFLSELDLLSKNIDHIKNIVAMQQNYASTAGFVEKVDVAALVEDALEINAAALTRHGVKVIRQFEKTPTILLDKHKALQILVNLIQNAKYALQESGRADKNLTIRLESTPDPSLRITVHDNGVGIPAENLTRIFSLGFTTRKKGHGFGLHACALAAREMNGSLKVHSEGSQQGASFILDLPLTRKEKTT